MNEAEQQRKRAFAAELGALALVFACLAVFLLARLLPEPEAGLLRRVGIAVPLTLAFALAAWRLGAVSQSGAVAGGVIALVVWLAGGSASFAVLLVVFLLTLGATRFGYERKRRLGTAERRGGRTAAQVVANLGVAAIVAVAAPHWFALGALAVFAEAAADTVSSEIGQALSERAWLITSFRSVKAGTNGGVTLAGTVAGIAAAAVVAATALGFRLLGWRAAVVACGAGVAGMVLDSVLGDLLERRGKLNNEAVNAISTAAAAAFALAVERA